MSSAVQAVGNVVSAAVQPVVSAAESMTQQLANAIIRDVPIPIIGGGSVLGSLVSGVEKVGQAIGSAVSSAANAVTNTVDNIVHNPVPVIEAAALTVALGPSGLDVAGTLVSDAGVSAGTAAAATNAVTQAAVAAANGGNVENIAKAAIGGGVGGVASGQLPSTIQGSETVAQIASSAVGADASATTNALLNGKPLDQALQSGLQSAGSAALSTAGGDVTSAAGQQIAQALPDTSGALTSIKETVQPVLTEIQQALPTVTKQDIQTAAAPLTQAVKPILTQAQQAAQPVLSAIEPVAQKAGDIIVGDITNAAKSGLSTGLSQALFGAGTPSATSTSGSPTQTAASPGSQALAQALNVGDVGGPLFDKTGGQQRNVWNQASLRVKDETGSENG